MVVFDTHCHLDKFDKIEFIKNQIAITCGYSHEANIKAIEISKKYKNVYYAIGIAPHSVLDLDDLTIVDKWIEFIKKNKPIAIGEIGLDYHWGKTIEEIKKEKIVFEKMLDLANEMKLPVIIHSRKAEEDIINRLIDFDFPVLLHCFSGNRELAKKAVKHNMLISISPISSDLKKKVIKDVGLNNLVVETDAPYLGKNLYDIYKSISIISKSLGVSEEKVEEETYKNAKEFFNI
jgi:TatD DNase family protein